MHMQGISMPIRFGLAVGDFRKKEVVLALAVVVVTTTAASAADLAARPYNNIPAPVASWTGFYVFGGGGSGLWAADSNVVVTVPGAFGPPGSALTRDLRLGGSGWFGTVGVGYDWQAGNWVAGVFSDGQFGEIRGSLSNHFADTEGRETLRTSYAA